MRGMSVAPCDLLTVEQHALGKGSSARQVASGIIPEAERIR